MYRPVHFEIPAEDMARVAAFYEKVFGWKFQKWGGPMEYWLITTGAKEAPGINGGMMKRGDITHTVNTIGVDNIDKTLQEVEATGGKVVMPKSEIPGVGQFAYCTDPEGTMFGVIQPAPMEPGQS